MEGAAPWGRVCSQAPPRQPGGTQGATTPNRPRRPQTTNHRNRTTATPQPPGPVCPRPRPRGGQPGMTLGGEFDPRSEQARAHAEDAGGLALVLWGLLYRTRTPPSPRFI